MFEGVKPTPSLLAPANLTRLGVPPLFSLTSNLPPFPALSTLLFPPTSCCRSGMWKPWASWVGGSLGGGTKVFSLLGMPLGAGQPTAPAVDSNTSAPRLLSTSVGLTPGPAGSWAPPASPTAPPEPGPEAGECLSALAVRLSHGTCSQKER